MRSYISNNKYKSFYPVECNGAKWSKPAKASSSNHNE